MRKVILYIASSLNGKIAKPDGDIGWLESMPNPDNSDHGYAEFMQDVDTTIQGYSTYAQIRGWDIEFPYAGLKNYVVTSKPDREPYEHVEFIVGDPTQKVKELVGLPGKNIWLIGGGRLNGVFLNAGLIDEIRVFVIPIVLDEGIEIFEGLHEDVMLGSPEVVPHSTGAVELRYSIERG